VAIRRFYALLFHLRFKIVSATNLIPRRYTASGDIFIYSFYNESKASALWAALTIWILNKFTRVTGRTGYHAVPFRVENLFIQFSPHPIKNIPMDPEN